MELELTLANGVYPFGQLALQVLENGVLRAKRLALLLDRGGLCVTLERHCRDCTAGVGSTRHTPAQDRFRLLVPGVLPPAPA